mmetsp:Transcript_31219/g.85646  ORF Transcript_31219/g.85646 Transcript_31219/m.85646 type:complete len:880 (+) Transcript_31219:66-2705(+)
MSFSSHTSYERLSLNSSVDEDCPPTVFVTSPGAGPEDSAEDACDTPGLGEDNSLTISFKQLVASDIASLEASIFDHHTRFVQRLTSRVTFLESQNSVLREQLSTKRQDLHEEDLSNGDAKSEDSSVGSLPGIPALPPSDVVAPPSSEAPKVLVKGSSRLTLLVPSDSAEMVPRDVRPSISKSAMRMSTSSLCPVSRGSNRQVSMAACDGGDQKHSSDFSANLGFQVLSAWQRDKSRASTFCRGSMVSMKRAKSQLAEDLLLVDIPDANGSEEDATKPRRSMHDVMIAPSSMKRICWEVLAVCFVAHEIIMVPLNVFGLSRSPVLSALAWIVRFFWLVDIGVSFFTGFIDPKGIVEMRPVAVAVRYLKTHFFFDLFVVCCDFTSVLVVRYEGRIHILRLLSYVRLLRVMRIAWICGAQELAEVMKQHIQSESIVVVAAILRIILLLIGLTHVVACSWHGLRSLSLPPKGDAEDAFMHDYLSAFHYALAMYNGGSVGNQPLKVTEQAFTVGTLLLSILVSTAFVGSLTTAMTRLQMVTSVRASLFRTLSRFLAHHSISRDLAVRVHRNAHHAIDEKRRRIPESSVELLSMISQPLVLELHSEIHSPTLNTHPFFRCLHGFDVASERQICHSAVKVMALEKHDVLFSEFEVPVHPKMFFVRSGRLGYRRSSSETVHMVEPGHWLSEANLWTIWMHHGTLTSHQNCELLTLDAQTFQKIVGKNGRETVIPYAETFVVHLNALGSESLTDVGMDNDQSCCLVRDAFPELRQSHGNDAPPAVDTKAVRFLTMFAERNPTAIGRRTPAASPMCSRRQSVVSNASSQGRGSWIRDRFSIRHSMRSSTSSVSGGALRSTSIVPAADAVEARVPSKPPALPEASDEMAE